MNTTTLEHIDVKSYLVIANGKYHVKLNWYNKEGKREQQQKSLGIEAIVGNKNLAKKKQKEVERQVEEEINTPKEIVEAKGPNILFGEYMKQWLDELKPVIEDTTYSSYASKVKVISEYFNKLNVTLSDLKKCDIKTFYKYLVSEKGIKAKTVKRYHANIHKALNEVVELELIPINTSDKMKLEKSEQYIANHYNCDELETLFDLANGNLIELHILLASYYGLRREEVCGLRWSAIDFVNHTISINHTVTQCNVDGKYKTVPKDRTKNTTSNRTLPLIERIEQLLLAEKERQVNNKMTFGNSYKNRGNYILVDIEGALIKPDKVTRTFKKLIDNNKDKLKKVIRFHDLRHSCASLLLANGINMKEIQQWLGHSSWNTTATIYAHLESDTKLKAANVIASILS